MALKIANITVNTERPRELAQWWAAALGGEVTADWGEYVFISAAEGPGMGFQYVEHPTPGRVHMDIVTDDVEAEVERLVADGAKHVADRGVDGLTWTTLADPDGNEFCVFVGH